LDLINVSLLNALGFDGLRATSATTSTGCGSCCAVGWRSRREIELEDVAGNFAGPLLFNGIAVEAVHYGESNFSICGEGAVFDLGFGALEVQEAASEGHTGLLEGVDTLGWRGTATSSDLGGPLAVDRRSLRES